MAKEETPKKTTNKPKKTTKKETIINNPSENQITEEKNEKENNLILTVLGIIVLVVVAIILFRLTYAYFTSNVIDKNPDNIDAQVLSADLLVRYEDGESNIELNGQIAPGDIVTKEFSIKNEGNDTGLYQIVLQNYENHFNREREETETTESDFIYNLFLIESENKESLIATGTLPYSNNPIQISIDSYEEVLVNTTNKYRIEIEYINFTDIDQSDDMGKELKALINIINVDDEKRTAATLTN